MINHKRLEHYPLPDVLDKSLEAAFENYHSKQKKAQHKAAKQAIMFLKVYLDCCDKKLHYLSLHQNNTELYREFHGFIYSEFSFSHRAAYFVLLQFQRMLTAVHLEAEAPEPKMPKLSSSLSEEIISCKEDYENSNKDHGKLRYYQGWVAKSKDNVEVNWRLAKFHQAYGEELTNKLWLSAQDYSRKKGGKTVKSYAQLFDRVTLKGIIYFCPTIKEFEEAGSFRNINTFIEHLFAWSKLEAKSQDKCLKNFYKEWVYQLIVIKELFIKTGIWSEPPYELFSPTFKTSPTNANTHRKVDEKGNAFNDKLVTHIPLSYSDDKTIEALLNSIETDIEHVTNACEKAVLKTMENFNKRFQLASIGSVKPLDTHGWKPNQPNFVDMTVDANRCATFHHYGYDNPRECYTRFLGIGGIAQQFFYDYGFLTSYTLYPFLFLLIKEHPAITRSWLSNFTLFDEKGKEAGFYQSGNLWVAESLKHRKGTAKAQQKIILNEKSKLLFEQIIELTSQAREWLKAKGNSDYRYLLLRSSGVSTPSRSQNIRECSRLSEKELLIAFLRIPSDNVSNDRIEGIINNLNITSFRGSCGVQVYLKTRSVKAMSEALGHENYNPKLLSHYLPDPILRYFQARWVRIFQNALVFEAMQESSYLFEAIDIKPDELDEFLRNHKLKPLPEHVQGGFVEGFDSEPQEHNNDKEAIIPVSEELLSVMNALVDLVDKAPSTQEISSVAANWYETSKYVLGSIETNDNCSELVREVFNAAKQRPIPVENLKGAVYVY